MAGGGLTISVLCSEVLLRQQAYASAPCSDPHSIAPEPIPEPPRIFFSPSLRDFPSLPHETSVLGFPGHDVDALASRPESGLETNSLSLSKILEPLSLSLTGADLARVHTGMGEGGRGKALPAQPSQRTPHQWNRV